MLYENLHVQLKVVKALNPATLLLVDSVPPEHDCLEVMDKVFSNQSDLTDKPISHLHVDYFTDGSSFVQDDIRFAACAVMTLDTVTEAHLMLIGTSAQKAELIALRQGLQPTAGMQVNISTDSKYAFTTIHVHGALYKERVLFNSRRKIVKYGQEILELLEAVWALK
jgi:ribonuclease HI